ncbi:Uncharacterized protein Adt_27717 [Abeliophyllum distichum]|uniref:Uncharacterized protein n=1 Tax=Abeliophyllum distichum TaxID=126358 RepID=A0ABD1RVP8_9LAMI
MGRQDKDQPLQPVQPPIREINTIFGGPHPGGSSNNSQKRYIREAKAPTNFNYKLHTHPMGTRRTNLITLFSNDAVGVHFSHNDGLVVRAAVARNALENDVSGL